MDNEKDLKELIAEEGDEKVFFAEGLDCLILRVKDLGHLCGYVRIPATHPLFKNSLECEGILEVHGGITWTRELKGREGWWVGFDCAHWDDYSPYVSLFARQFRPSQYRTMEYVEKELRKLAKQIVEYKEVKNDQEN